MLNRIQIRVASVALRLAHIRFDNFQSFESSHWNDKIEYPMSTKLFAETMQITEKKGQRCWNSDFKE